MSAELPVLKFRRGFTLASGKLDSPILLIEEIFDDEIYLRELRSEPEGIVLDIGANIGAVALDFALRWPQLRVHSYEPNPGTFQSLRRNIMENHVSDRVALFNEAVGAKVGTFDLWTEILSVGASGYIREVPPNAKLVSLPCVDLATVFQRLEGKTIFLLKVDVEGAEVDIFENTHGLSFADVRQVAIECHEQVRPGALEVCRGTLDRHGFQCKTLAVAEHAGVYMLYGWKG